ncbi:hypothetical protein, partial [Pseudomonas amygdali]|uniref:hypothetical protein n=1 Tax=Pseudomonas amygdali TaxID=47877 RepID=UPI001C7E90DD
SHEDSGRELAGDRHHAALKTLISCPLRGLIAMTNMRTLRKVLTRQPTHQAMRDRSVAAT